MKRYATAVWNGTIKEGKGYLTTASKVLDKTSYSFKSRFEEGSGTNPEELLAAAHAGCFTMKVSADLSEAGFSLETRADISFEDGRITRSELHLTARIPGIDDNQFQQIVQKSKENCPVSIAFSFEITLEATLQK